MGPLTNKSHNVFYDGNWVTKSLNDIQQRKEKKNRNIESFAAQWNSVQLVDPLLRISHLNCLKCEKRTVKVLRGKSTGDLATLSVTDPGVGVSGPLLSVMFTWGVNILPRAFSNNLLSEPSVKTPSPPWIPPLLLPPTPSTPSISCVQTPSVAPRVPDSPPRPLAPSIDWFLR